MEELYRIKFGYCYSNLYLIMIFLVSMFISRSYMLSSKPTPLIKGFISSNTCGDHFPKECFCGREKYEDQNQYIVNCTNAGLTNTSILKNMPDNTQVLIFTGNRIKELPWNVFGAINNYNYLEIVDMSNNQIQEIRGKTYHHVSNVKRLILNHNNLTISHDSSDVNHHHPRVFSNFINLESLHLTNAFADYLSPALSEDLHDIFVNSNLTKLQKLHLEQNEISHFKDRKVFCDLPSLRDLHLGDNLINEINFDVKCLKHLRFLDFTRNRFEYIKAKDLDLLDNLELEPNRTSNLIVDLEFNPFVCDCRIIPLQKWIQTTAVSVRNKETLTCFMNQNSEHILLAQYGKCMAKSEHTDENHRTSAFLVFLLIVLSFTLVGLLAALVYISRDRLKICISPVVTSISRKVQYSTIKNEDYCEVMV
ncbi:hypothetical protein ACFFRR_001024 [Megaselia abdita]